MSKFNSSFIDGIFLYRQGSQNMFHMFRSIYPLHFDVNTLLYVAGLLGWLGFWPFDALYTQRIRIGWGQMMVLFIWPQSHLYGKINTKARSSLCCPWWGQHLGHYSGPICSLSRKLANCASKFG
jgi:hypothetical protein